MGKRDSSTPNKDYWHSTHGNFYKCDQALFPVLGVGPMDEAMQCPLSALWVINYLSTICRWKNTQDQEIYKTNQQLFSIKGNTQYVCTQGTNHTSMQLVKRFSVQMCVMYIPITVSTFISEPWQHFRKLDMAWCELVLQVWRDLVHWQFRTLGWVSSWFHVSSNCLKR